MPFKVFKRLKRLPGNQDGFSLVEMLTALAVLGIVLAIAIPNFSKWKEKHEINGQAQKVYLDLMLARASAVRSNNNVLVVFNTAGNSYKVHSDTDGDGVEDAGEQIKNVNLEEYSQFAYNTGITDIDGNSVSAAVSFSGSQTVTFDSRGQASASGSVFLLHKNDVSKTNERARYLSVLQATGSVEYWSYDASKTPPWS